MLRRATQRLAIRRTPALAAGGPDDANPKWNIPTKDYLKYSFQPSIPDQHFYGAHYNYAPITMWLRQRRPTMEFVGSAVYQTVTGAAISATRPIANFSETHFPGIGCKLFGIVGVCVGLQLWINWANDWNSARMMLEKLQAHKHASELDTAGFWNTHSEDVNGRAQDFNVDRLRLEALWEGSIAEATQTNSFDALCDGLSQDLHPAEPKEPITWRFNMMPYGAGCPNTAAFPHADNEIPGSPFTLMELGSYGDYIDRTDNKPNPIRKARHLYAGAYIPPTK